jgi:predicted nuclease of predicted toxin-antitoxin system
MKIKLFMDEDVYLALALAIRKRGYDAVHVSELNLKGKSDDEQLRYAIEDQRCIFSFNIKDFVLLHHE